MKAKKTPKKTHTIIISDLHLGSPVSQPLKVLKMLQEYSFRKLILLGDIFDDLDFRNLSKESWELLTYIGKISKERKVRWVEGNHDKGLSEIFSALLGARVYKKTYTWIYKQKKYLAIHGHQFDRFLIDNVVLSRLATIVYNIIQKIDTDDKKFSHYVKKTSKGWLRLSEKITKAAIVYGKKHKAEFVFCGHTHKDMQKEDKKHNIKYYNSGCWTDIPCTYITIDDGGIKIREY
ncbi:MAG: metallophosphoesterase [Candidatus Moraniibacteriota bacterium]